MPDVFFTQDYFDYRDPLEILGVKIQAERVRQLEQQPEFML